MENNQVPCNGCKICCTKEMLILHPEDGDVIENYRTVRVQHPITKKPAIALQTKYNGDCTYLGDTGCTIYENRPKVCRDFDCRKMFMRFMDFGGRQARKRAIKEGWASQEVFDAGRTRLHTLKEGN